MLQQTLSSGTHRVDTRNEKNILAAASGHVDPSRAGSPIDIRPPRINVSEAGIAAHATAKETFVAQITRRPRHHRGSHRERNIQSVIRLVPRCSARTCTASIVSRSTIGTDNFFHRHFEMASNAIRCLQRRRNIFPQRRMRQLVPDTTAMLGMGIDDLLHCDVFQVETGEEIHVIVQVFPLLLHPSSGQKLHIHLRIGWFTEEKRRCRFRSGKQSRTSAQKNPKCFPAPNESRRKNIVAGIHLVADGVWRIRHHSFSCDFVSAQSRTEKSRLRANLKLFFVFFSKQYASQT